MDPKEWILITFSSIVPLWVATVFSKMYVELLYSFMKLDIQQLIITK